MRHCVQPYTASPCFQFDKHPSGSQYVERSKESEKLGLYSYINGKITITTNSHNRPINNSISPKERLLSKTGDVVSEKGRDLRNILLILVKGIIFQCSIAT